MWRSNSRKNEEMESKQKQHPVVDVTGDGSKVRCYKEQYCIATWNVSSTKESEMRYLDAVSKTTELGGGVKMAEE